MTVRNADVFRLQVVSDIVCPWCFIGKRALDEAIVRLSGQRLDVEVEWLPYQLNPTLPAQGMDRKTFRSARFGSWENALTMDARAVAAGKKVGAVFNYDRQALTSNTLAAHALSRLAFLEAGADVQAKVMEALFVAYFTDGKDVGDRATLAQIAQEAGLAGNAMERAAALYGAVDRLETAVRASGLDGVPSYLVDGQLLFSGSQSADGYAHAISAAAGTR